MFVVDLIMLIGRASVASVVIARVFVRKQEIADRLPWDK